jgi:hypothetical protein
MSILIAIGKQQRKFNVLESFLEQKTSFFNRHGPPPTLEEENDGGSNQMKTGASISNTVDLDMDLDVKTQEGSANATEIEERAGAGLNGSANPNKAKLVPHYHILSKIHTPQAFKTFVDWLYNISPSVPEDKADCKLLLQAYVLAVQYDAFPLQNAIVDCFRQYHIQVPVDLDHLVWMINNTEDSIRLPMTGYLVQQIAYQIALHGIEKYEKDNQYMSYYMTEGDRLVRYELVKAIAYRATSSGRKAGNPAILDASKWYVTG